MNLVALLKLKLLIKIENKIAKTNSVADGVPAILHSHCSQKLAAPLLISYICYLFLLGNQKPGRQARYFLAFRNQGVGDRGAGKIHL